ncbi:mechanosensitive ion channel family protein [filamentous cyanobacterium LEGE 11480]|uniref:Mechanosensitive ion channel family protein n=1 Tax=Romeriopsis navalis LEGE 11480 TaxID=2777977 RepID=A0A928Z5E0_9CYAN|nr:mechanosensitive ion channel family protein [Romeriopsis navalis]MBE9031368.1 mechanosensitive ion channel family protein [Romeriopsis navalis LEGE 11480]
MEDISLAAAWDKIGNMLEYSIRLIPNLILGIIVFVIFWIIARIFRTIVRKIAQTRKKSRNVGLVFGRLAQGGIIILGILVAATIVFPSFQPADLLNTLGIGGVAIGFAFRDVLQNFLAGILILLTEPFQIDDQIVFKGFEGTVERIQTRATIIRTYDGRRVVIPNAELFTNSVTVNTAHEQRRLQYDFGIGYGDDIAKTKRLILEVLNGNEDIVNHPAPEVLVVELADCTINLRARWWINPPNRAEALDSRDRVLEEVCNTLVGHGIDLPFPTQQILFHDQTEETDGDRTRQREGWPAGKVAMDQS